MIVVQREDSQVLEKDIPGLYMIYISKGMEKEFTLSSPHTGFIIEWSSMSQVFPTAWKLQENMLDVSLEIGASLQKQYFSLLTNTSVPPHAQPPSGLMDSS